MTTREELIEVADERMENFKPTERWDSGGRRQKTEAVVDAILAKLSESKDDFPRCEAVCFVGPGHQSKMRCELQLGHSGEHVRARDWYEWAEDGECVD